MNKRRSKTSGPRRRPARYGDGPAPADLAAGLRAHKAGRWAEALARYDARPDDPEARLNAAAVRARLGQAAAVRRDLEAALARLGPLAAPVRARALRDAALALSAVGDTARARALLADALAVDPSLVGALLWQSRLAAEAGDDAAAVEAALRATSLAPGEAAAWLELFRARFDDRALGPARAVITRACEIDPGYRLARCFRAGVAALSGEAPLPTAPPADPEVPPGFADALGEMRRLRTAETRFFASSRRTIACALAAARGDGPVLEFGVRHGVSTRVLAELAAGGTAIVAFDSFEGLPRGWYDHAPGAFTTCGEIPALPPEVEVRAGWFSDTLPRYLAEGRRPPRLVHIDSDLYESAREVLFALGPTLADGTVILFDEYFHNEGWREDEHRAFEEARRAFALGARLVAASFVTGQAAFVLELGPP